jgi:hypothetical protein
MKKITFEISDEAFNLLKKLNAAEYRDTEFETLEDFKNSEEYKSGKKTEEWFLNRNYGGTLYLIRELEECGLVEHDCESWHITEHDCESWHITYIVSDFGKKILDKSSIRHEKIDDILN